jgi:nucleoside phosphorylase
VIICAGDSEQFEFAKPMGIGLIDMSINLTKELLESRVDSILFVGSAGSYGNRDIFDIVLSSSATNIENSFFNANSYTPIENRVFFNKVSHETTVNSSNYITTDIQLAKKYLQNGIDLENMEFFAVLKVAKSFNIPAKGIFIVTNYCNKDAHRDFIKNHKEAMDRLSEYIKKREII